MDLAKMGRPGMSTGQAPTRVRGRVLRFEYAKEVLLGTKFEARVLRRDKKWWLGGGGARF
jgi:hypothetical protein